MPDSPGNAAPTLRDRTIRSYQPREGRAAGVPLTVKRFREDGREVYVPSFPLVFQTKGLTYGKAWEVFNTHYLQRGLYGAHGSKAALMDLTHYGLWMHLQFLASHGEKFYAADVAANLGCEKKRGATKAHTVGRWLDRLENLRLVQRIRNGNSRERFISVLLAAPLAPAKMNFAGPELMRRVETEAVETERREAGPGRWPFLVWDHDMVRRHLKGEAKVVERVDRMQDIISLVNRRFNEGGYGEDFEASVKRECERRRVAWSPKLFLTAMTWRKLNAKPAKEAPL